ncbi:NaeI family type II restriction endonuclease [Mycobacterium sp. DL440]|uniref:NaeI family type II restriction endonuclease n=1 Tax=Mycobacterium sp. DL440 TaxID=2675523 RepID=UPI001420228A|nr:NaeI family type II restriction endonuclease [Mycobacterium sp. DL440]
MTEDSHVDSAVEEVAAEILRLDPTGARWGAVLRHTYDMIYNGPETGRFRWSELAKTERTHFGTVFEINAQREFGFNDGKTTDYRIAGHQVDAKWSQTDGGWMLPPEVFDEIALVATGSDPDARFSLGLIRVAEAYRREGSNRDKKSSLNPIGRQAIKWLWRDAPMPASILLQLPDDVVAHIFDNRYGTQRVNRLFRATEGRLVHRNTVRTVAMQLDDQKRVRTNGGARSALKPEGYIILSSYHAHLARALGVPEPDDKHYISVRVTAGSGKDPLIQGCHWRRAIPNDPQCEAPILPERGVREE